MKKTTVSAWVLVYHLKRFQIRCYHLMCILFIFKVKNLFAFRLDFDIKHFWMYEQCQQIFGYEGSEGITYLLIHSSLSLFTE